MLRRQLVHRAVVLVPGGPVAGLMNTLVGFPVLEGRHIREIQRRGIQRGNDRDGHCVRFPPVNTDLVLKKRVNGVQGAPGTRAGQDHVIARTPDDDSLFPETRRRESGIGKLGGGGADDAMKAQLDGYGKSIGLAFQIVDDILDVEGSVENLGNIPGADRARGKATYPGLLGLNGARAEAHRLRTIALESIEPFGAAGRPLELIANFIVDRSQ